MVIRVRPIEKVHHALVSSFFGRTREIRFICFGANEVSPKFLKDLRSNFPLNLARWVKWCLRELFFVGGVLEVDGFGQA